MGDPRRKLQGLLRTLFQVDCADLDFGLYRVLNHLRPELERFLARELPALVSRALGPGARAQEALAFDHLARFFGRYCRAGDPVARRRYRARNVIAPAGEEVSLHWISRGQYFVKAGDDRRDYRFRAAGATVRFQLREIGAEQATAVAERRLLIPQLAAMAWDSTTRELTIPFEHRSPTASELARWGTRGRQTKINAEVLQDLPARLKRHPTLLAALLDKRRAPGSRARPLLEHHLRQYARRATSDCFLHKDLQGFLTREFDRYLREEVLDLDRVLDGAESGLPLLRAVRAAGLPIIAFLVRIEEFQRQLFEKRKLVLSTEYCVRLACVPDELLPEIAANRAQVQEWQQLFGLDLSHLAATPEGARAGNPPAGSPNKATPPSAPAVTLNAQLSTLILDTRHFDQDFKDRLLSALDALAEQTDVLLLQSENFQALNLLLPRYRETIDCVYIDPPYNSQTAAILYRNAYRPSSWLSLMENRLELSKRLAARDGSHVVAVDENEQEALGQLLVMHFPDHARVCVAVVHNKKGTQGDYFSYNHDYAYFCLPPALAETHGKPIPEEEWQYENLRKWGRESTRDTARHCFYPIYVEGGRIVGFGEVCAESFHPGRSNVTCDAAGRRVAVYPVDGQGIERKWRYARHSVEGIRRLLRAHVTPAGEIQIRKAKAERQFKTVWDDPAYIAGDHGTRWLTDLGLKPGEDLFPKSLHTVADSIHAVSGPEAIVLDYFAGSGTTGHAVIALNRADGGRRKAILVELGEHFDTVLLPRLKKVIFAPEWRDGRPARLPTEEEAARSPRLLKYCRLESYEDALDNVALPSDPVADGPLLRYGLGSAELLTAAQFASPFDCRLRVSLGGRTREHPVDLPETFAYLIGLRVRTRRVCCDRDRRYLIYRGSNAGGEIAVIWRDVTGWRKADFARERRFVAKHGLIAGAERVYVNADSLLPGARSLDGLFAERMLGKQ